MRARQAMNILLAILPPAAPDYPLLGAAALAGAIQAAGHRCHIHDANIALHHDNPGEQWRWRSEGWASWDEPNEHAVWIPAIVAALCENVEALDCVDGVALSATNAGQPLAAATIAALTSRYPKIPIIIGGPGFFHDSDIATFTAGKQASICQGEGDLAILDWIAALQAGTPLEPRIFSARVARLDDLPYPDFSAFKQANYTRPGVLPLETSRGCTNRCAFCDDAQMWGRYRVKAPRRIGQEIHNCLAKAIHISFCDSLMNPTPQRICSIAEHIGQHGISWEGMLQCRGIDYEIAKILSDSGCTDVFLGVESLTQKTLNTLNKSSSAKEAFTAIESLHRAGIRVSIGLIVLGPPLQTRTDFEHDLLCIKGLAPCLSTIAVNPLCIPQGTPLWSARRKIGIRLPNVSPWKFWHGDGGASDVEKRFSWCVEALEAIQSQGIDTGTDKKTFVTQTHRTIAEAWRCL